VAKVSSSAGYRKDEREELILAKKTQRAAKRTAKTATRRTGKVGRPAKRPARAKKAARPAKKIGRPAKKASAAKKVGRPAKRGRPPKKLGRPAKKAAAKSARRSTAKVRLGAAKRKAKTAVRVRKTTGAPRRARARAIIEPAPRPEKVAAGAAVETKAASAAKPPARAAKPRARRAPVAPSAPPPAEPPSVPAVDLADEGFLEVAGQRLEFRMIGPRPHEAPTLVLLHEGLGSVGQWNSFPDKLAKATDVGVFVYSRAGYGKSSPVPLPRPLTYMQDEALQVLPKLLDAIGFRRGIFIGHSDGASIATIYTGSIEDHRMRGLVLFAPHFFTEDMGIASIAAAREAYATTDLREKLARWHADVDNAFRGWNDAWLDPDFRKWDITDSLAFIRVPILIVQGRNDQYGTVRQIEAAQEECYCPVDVVMVEGRHSPYRDAPEETLRVTAEFVNHLLRDHHEGDLATHAA
jgi:pimeloyl-ACP methyl ester carboxylesterase